MSNPRRILPAIPYIPQQKEAPYPTEARFGHQLLIIRGIGPFAHVNRDLAWLATGVQLKNDYVYWF